MGWDGTCAQFRGVPSAGYSFLDILEFRYGTLPLSLQVHLPRNCAQVNSHLVALAIALGANTDCQPILTAKGVADYVCKYITKYGAGQSVSSRIASLLDDIVSRVPEGKTITGSS